MEKLYSIFITVARESAIVIMLVLCFSCHKTTVYNNQQVESVDSSKVKIVSIPSLSGKEVGLFSDVYSSVKYVPLESTTKSLIGEITRLIVSKTGNFIVYDKNNGYVLVFDANGKFLNSIGHCGHGSMEYIFADEIAYNFEKDQILVYDNAKKTIMYYDIKGNFLSKIQLNYHVRTFDVVDRNHVAIYMDYDADFRNKDIDYNYKILDEYGEEVMAFDPFKEDMCYFNPACRGTFHHFADKLYCQSPYSSYISELSSDDMIPRYYLSFGKDGIPQDWKKGDIHDFNKKIKKYSNLVFCENFYETHEYFVMNLIRNKMFCNLLLKKGSEASISAFTWINNVFGLVSSTQVKNVYNDCVYYIIDNSVFQQVYNCTKELPCNENISIRYADNLFRDISLLSFMENNEMKVLIKDLKEKYRTQNLRILDQEKELIRTCAENNNPIIQICTLK